MKTAMQEMIEYLENIYYVKEILDWEDIKKNIIKKEKEQIIKAHIDGFDHIVVDFKKQEYAEQYYNQTYNQKQHIIDIMKADEDDGLYNQNES
jgi:hypothetical protein